MPVALTDLSAFRKMIANPSTAVALGHRRRTQSRDYVRVKTSNLRRTAWWERAYWNSVPTTPGPLQVNAGRTFPFQVIL